MVKTRKNKKMVGGAGDYYTESTIVSNTKFGIQVPEYKGNLELYLKTYGLLKLPKGLDFAKDMKDIVDDAYTYLNPDPKNKPNYDPHVEFIPSPEGAKYNKVFGDFRKYLIENKDAIAVKLVAANATFTLEYLKMEPGIPHEFVFVLPPDPSATVPVAPPATVEDATAALNAFFTTIVDDNPLPSTEEMNIIKDPDNYENAIFVIGQVFGIIAPDFNGDLLSFDNDAMNALFDPKFFIDLYKKIKPPSTP